MQLLFLLALFLTLGNKSGGGISGDEMEEIIKYATGNDGKMTEIINEAHRLTEVIQAVAPIAQAFSGAQTEKTQHETPKPAESSAAEEVFSSSAANQTPVFLQPIANIADDGIYNALARALQR